MLLQIERKVIKFMPKATKLVLVLQDKFFLSLQKYCRANVFICLKIFSANVLHIFKVKKNCKKHN